MSISGPVATSGAHFLAALVFVRNLPAAEFGLFSFVLVIVPFCMSMIAAALVLPVNRSLDANGNADPAIVAVCLKLNLLLCALAALAVFGFLLLAHAAPAPALLLALFGAALTCRWFVRCFAFVQGKVAAAVASDLLYALILICGLGALVLSRHVSLMAGAGVMLLAALAALVPFGRAFFREQLHAMRHGRIGAYRLIFRDLTRWSLLGVVLTEITVNAHAYLVTFLSGSGTFALLALGTLLMRPISLVQSALPDLERPVMTRGIAARDWPRLTRILREFRIALLLVWLGTMALAFALLTWFPQWVLKKGYAEHDVIIVTLLTATIMLLRNVRTPLATFMQAAGQFKELAAIGMRTSVISIGVTLALLLAFGPIASLGGILAGEAIIIVILKRMLADWKQVHV